jgi:hypothetical protein
MSDLTGLEPFLGYFQYESAENLEPILRAFGQNIIMRKLSLACSPSASLLWVEKDGKKMLRTTYVRYI